MLNISVIISPSLKLLYLKKCNVCYNAHNLNYQESIKYDLDKVGSNCLVRPAKTLSGFPFSRGKTVEQIIKSADVPRSKIHTHGRFRPMASVEKYAAGASAKQSRRFHMLATHGGRLAQRRYYVVDMAESNRQGCLGTVARRAKGTTVPAWLNSPRHSLN